MEGQTESGKHLTLNSYMLTVIAQRLLWKRDARKEIFIWVADENKF